MDRRRVRTNEAGLDANGGEAIMGGHARVRGEVAVVEIEFDERFRMLRNEGDRRHNERNPFPAGPYDLLVCGGFDPREGSNATLITDPPVEARLRECFDDCRRRLFDLAWIRITRAHDLHRQAVCG